MITMKHQLLTELKMLKNDKKIKTIEQLQSGERNEMFFDCSIETVISIISEYFNDDLEGCVPNGANTKILGWEILDITV